MKLPSELKILADLERLEKENDVLRGIIANSKIDCIYCGLKKSAMAECASGFPGCARLDDITNAPNYNP